MNPKDDANSETGCAGLSERDLDPNPVRQFDQWFQQALVANLTEPTAMTLATASRDGAPSARIVLLKSYDERGFVFFTNYESQKGRELTANPRAALVFFWASLERQIRVSGNVDRITRDESELYFYSRPFGSRCGAWASHQSNVIHGRSELDLRYQQLLQQYEGKDVPLPPFWGGYRVAPATFEFWQGRPSRLHDRFRYTRLPSSEWRIDRLSP